ncbi:MAG: hydrogenase formation protein HypD [Gammaproteobacteria bacterium]|nr:hydrogenase formation protein HypD [Gammaproteobacteria bacterium]
MKNSPQQWLTKIREVKFDRTIRILNVCGGHERSISNSGIRTLLPEYIQLIPGPGCPICVCPTELINQSISLSRNPDIILACFGDMINVPANNKKGEIQSLSEAKAMGSNVEAVASPMEVIKLANTNQDKTIVFFVAGFETTMAPIAAMIEQINATSIKNIKFLIAGRKTWPIVFELFKDQDHGIDGVIAPGHVATIMGAQEWQFIPDSHKIPCSISGFTVSSVLESIYTVLKQIQTKKACLNNCYKEAVTDQGNLTAKNLLDKYFENDDAPWRGIGLIDESGFKFKSEFTHFDAANLIETTTSPHLTPYLASGFTPKLTIINKSESPAGCDCPKVIMGKLSPFNCKLFDKACTPSNPIGPCMVSDEGACNIWWLNGEHLKTQQAQFCST